MATLSALRTEVRRRVGETSTTFFADAEINSLLNEAQRNFASAGGIVEADKGFSIVANQYEYAAPADFINSRFLMLDEDTKLRYTTPREWMTLIQTQPGETGEPVYYSIWEKTIRLHPAPATAATSDQLNGAISGADVTITLDDASSFPKSGRVIIDSEEIQYFNTSATQLLQCKRAQGGTTAASHSDNATVTAADLRLFYYQIPTAMSGDTSTPDIPTEYHDILTYYAAGMLKIKDRLYDQGRELISMYDQMKFNAIREIKRRQRDKSPRVIFGDRGYNTSLGKP